jgi:predicted dehydrogenase
MSRKVKVGLVGLGSLAQRGILPHTFQDDAREKLEAVAVCDNVPGRAAATAERWNWREAYVDYDEMLARADVEAVLIATPIPLHHRQVIAALRAGKHVYVQKAMTTTLAEADEVVRLAKEKGLKLCASPGEMLRPPWPQVRDVVREGLLGRVYWALAGMQSSGHENEAFRREDNVLSSVDPAWYYKPGGGPIYDMTVYCLHELTGVLGPVRRVSAMSGIGLPIRQWKDRTIEVEMDDNTHLLLDFGDNTFGFAFGANCRGSKLPRLAIHGTDGAIEVPAPPPAAQRAAGAYRPRVTLQSKHVEGGQTELEVPELPYRVGPHREIGEAHGYADVMHLIDCILDDRDPIPSGEHARHVVEIIEKGYQAAREGRTIELSTTI